MGMCINFLFIFGLLVLFTVVPSSIVPQLSLFGLFVRSNNPSISLSNQLFIYLIHSRSHPVLALGQQLPDVAHRVVGHPDRAALALAVHPGQRVPRAPPVLDIFRMGHLEPCEQRESFLSQDFHVT